MIAAATGSAGPEHQSAEFLGKRPSPASLHASAPAKMVKDNNGVASESTAGSGGSGLSLLDLSVSSAHCGSPIEATLHEQIEMLKKKISDLNAQKEQLSTENRGLKDREASSVGLQEKIRDLEKQLAHVRKNLDQEILTRRQVAEELRKANLQAAKIKGGDMGRIAANREKCERLVGTINTSHASKKLSDHEKTKEIERIIENEAKDDPDVHAYLSLYADKVRLLRKVKRMYDEYKAQRDSNFALLSEQKENFQKEASAKDERTQKQMAELEMRMDNMNKAYRDKCSELARRINAHQSTAKELEAAKHEQTTLRDEISDLKACVGAAKLTNAELKKKLEKAEKNTEHYKKVCASYESKSQRNEKEIADLKAQIAVLTEKIRQFEDQCKTHEQALEAAKQRAEQLEAEIKRLTASYTELSEKNKDLMSQICTATESAAKQGQAAAEHVSPVRATDKDREETEKLSYLRREMYIPMTDVNNVCEDMALCMQYQKCDVDYVNENFITLFDRFVFRLKKIETGFVPTFHTPEKIAIVTALEFEWSYLMFCLASCLSPAKFLMEHPQVPLDRYVDENNERELLKSVQEKLGNLWFTARVGNPEIARTPEEFCAMGVPQIEVLKATLPRETLKNFLACMETLQPIIGKLYRKHVIGHTKAQTAGGIRDFLFRTNLIQGHNVNDIQVRILGQLSANLDVETVYVCEVSSTKKRNKHAPSAAGLVPSMFPKNGFRFLFRSRRISTQGPGDAALTSARILAQLKLRFIDSETNKSPVFGHPYTREKKLLPFPIQYAYAVAGFHTVVSVEEYIEGESMDELLEKVFCAQATDSANNEKIVETIADNFQNACTVVCELDRYGLFHRNLVLRQLIRDSVSGQWIVGSFYHASSRKDVIGYNPAHPIFRKEEKSVLEDLWDDTMPFKNKAETAITIPHHVSGSDGENEDMDINDAEKTWFNFMTKGLLWNFSNISCRYPPGSFLRSLRAMMGVLASDMIQWIRSVCNEEVIDMIPALSFISVALANTDPDQLMNREARSKESLSTIDFVKFLDPEFVLWFEKWRAATGETSENCESDSKTMVM